MKSSKALISLLLLAILVITSLAQDSQPAARNQQNTVPPVTVSPESAQPVSESSSLSSTQPSQPEAVQPVEARPNNIQTNQPKSEISKEQATLTEPNQPVNPSSATQASPQTDHESVQVGSMDKKTKQKIKQLISEMSPEELTAFQEQLNADSRKYYDEIMAEEDGKIVIEQKQIQEELKQVQEEQTPTTIQHKKQSDEFNKQWDKYTDRELSYNQYLFELNQAASSDFRFTIPVAQYITFYGYTYENNEGVYSVPQSIDDQKPLWIYVYENNHRIVFQKDFYFKYFGGFQGNENSSYLIRFVNPASHKLIAFNLQVLFEIGHSADKLTAVDVADHSRRLKVSRQQVINRYQDIGSREMMATENRGQLMEKLDRYYAYSIVEILIIAVLCVMQVEFVRKLLASTSVV